MAQETTTRIYELQVKLATESLAQLKKLQQHTKDIDQRFKDMGASVKGFGLSLLSAFSVQAIVGAVNQAITLVDELGAAAQRVGVGVEQFSALAYAAEQSDMAMADLEIGLKELQKSMVEVGTKGANVLDALGIDKSKPQVEVLKDFAEAFKSIQDPALRTNALLEVFGKSGLKLRPLLESGAGGIEALMAKAKELGFVLTEETAKAFSDLDNAIKNTKRSGEILTRELTTGMAPALTDVMEAFQEAARTGEDFQALGGILGEILRGLAAGVLTVVQGFKQLGLVIYGVTTAAWKAFVGDLKGAGDELRDMDRKLANNTEAFSRSMEKVLGASEATTKATTATEKNTKAVANNDAAIRKALEAKEKEKKAREDEVSLFGKLAEALDDILFKLRSAGSEQTEFDRALRKTAETFALLNPLEQAHVMIQLAGIRANEQANIATKKRVEAEKEVVEIIKSHRTEEEKFYDDIQRYLNLMNQFPESAAAMGDAIERRTKQYNDSLIVTQATVTETDKLLEALADKVDGYAKSMASSLVDFATHADNAKFSFADFAASVIRDMMKMMMQMVVMEPLMASFKQWLKDINKPSASTSSGTTNGLFGAAITAAFEAYTGNARGGVYTSPSLSKYSGGVYSTPHTFTFAKGGVFGEAGAEAIMPLTRGPDGTLGVAASGGEITVNVINEAGAEVDVQSTKNANGARQITVLIQQAVMDGFARGKFDSVMGATYGVTRRGH